MCNTTSTMVTAVRTTLNPKTSSHGGGGGGGGARTRPPLLPSDPDNSLAPRRIKSRDATSRYLSSSSSSALSSVSASSNSRRCASPLVSRTAAAKVTPASPAKVTPASPAAKRSQSAERKRPVTPRTSSSDSRNWIRAADGGGGGGEMSSAQKILFTSTRSLSVSFQGESFSFQVSKAKPSPAPSVRKSTPERRKMAAATPASENAKSIEHQQRWPGFRSSSFGDERRAGTGSGGNVVRALESSMADYGRRLMPVADVSSSAIGSESASEDCESVSSASTNSGTTDTIGQGQRGPRGFVVPARFLQDTKSRLHRQPEPGSPLSSRTPSSVRAFATASKLIVPPKKLSMDSPVSSPRGVVNSRGQSSPMRGTFRPASPSKASSTPLSRGISPSRARSLVPATPGSNYSSNVPSILSFAVDVRRGKVGESRIHDAHVLRLLYNRLLQWHFVNARADAAHSAQRLNAERSLYNAWVTTANLRESVRAKRTELQSMRQTLKLISILKGQMTYLDEWSHVDQAYTGSLSGATEALRASTLRLPVIGGARAEIQNIKDAICSAVDVLQAMVSSIGLLSPKVEVVNSSMSELTNLTAKERALLSHCRILLSTVAALQVKESSLSTHIAQLKRVQT